MGLISCGKSKFVTLLLLDVAVAMGDVDQRTAAIVVPV